MHHTKTDYCAAINRVRLAALDSEPIAGLTHTFYRYPARFSPVFARAAVKAFSEPGQVVLDPYMGGGTTVIEAFAAGRIAIGADINSLACFVARVKTTSLTRRERDAVSRWAGCTVQDVRYSDPLESAGCGRIATVPRNLTLPEARPLRKAIALCIRAAEEELPTPASRRFARCVMLNVGQWALNGRRRIPRVDELRDRVLMTCADMLSGLADLQTALRQSAQGRQIRPVIIESDAADLPTSRVLKKHGPADLVVTSPPYPGIHMLYHRWQVDGRKETDAPYWIAACNDGAGSAFYNFADRRRNAEDRYFEKAQTTFGATRELMRDGAILVQMIAFAEPDRQIRRYLNMMKRAGFAEQRGRRQRRTWRDVPGRRWHANLKGGLASSREVVLVHVAV